MMKLTVVLVLALVAQDGSSSGGSTSSSARLVSMYGPLPQLPTPTFNPIYDRVPGASGGGAQANYVPAPQRPNARANNIVSLSAPEPRPTARAAVETWPKAQRNMSSLAAKIQKHEGRNKARRAMIQQIQQETSRQGRIDRYNAMQAQMKESRAMLVKDLALTGANSNEANRRLKKFDETWEKRFKRHAQPRVEAMQKHAVNLQKEIQQSDKKIQKSKAAQEKWKKKALKRATRKPAKTKGK